MPHDSSLVLDEVPPAFPDKEHGQENIQEQAKALAMLEGTMTEHVIKTHFHLAAFIAIRKQ